LFNISLFNTTRNCHVQTIRQTDKTNGYVTARYLKTLKFTSKVRGMDIWPPTHLATFQTKGHLEAKNWHSKTIACTAYILYTWRYK